MEEEESKEDDFGDNYIDNLIEKDDEEIRRAVLALNNEEVRELLVRLEIRTYAILFPPGGQ